MAVNVYEGFRDISSEILISQNENNAFPRHFHRNLELLYVRSGMMKSKIHEETFDCGQDDIIFVPSYYAHEFSTPDASDVVVLNIPYSLISELNDFFSKSQLDFFLGDKEYNKNIREVLELLLRSKETYNQYTLKGFVYILFGLLIHHYPAVQAAKRNNNIELIVKILNYIDQNYQNNISLGEIAEYFNYNKYYISRVFNQYVGKNFKFYLNSVRVQHVVSLYSINPRASISSLAFDCGFENMATFYRAFRENYSISPKLFFSRPASVAIDYNVVKF
ncbi:MAG: helix-turn-helix domain-containing protein [Clostridia bacterium]|nr:helix-turn-helix domain-containing protein [Clostridia bacterium]